MIWKITPEILERAKVENVPTKPFNYSGSGDYVAQVFNEPDVVYLVDFDRLTYPQLLALEKVFAEYELKEKELENESN